MGLGAIATNMISETAKIGRQVDSFLKTKHKGPTGGVKTPKAKRKAQRAARRNGRGK